MKGANGIFLVAVDGKTVIQKTPELGFPTEAQVVDAVRAAKR